MFLLLAGDNVICLQVDARTLAEETGSQVQHPLLDKVRQCSTNPEQAVAFFCQILSPKPHIRRQAIHHAWCAEMVGRMFKETRTSYPPDNAPDDYFSEEDAGCMPASCEALSGCFSCFLPKVQDDNKAARQQAREEERLRQQQEKLSGPPIGQQTASGPEPGSQSSKVRSRFKSAASKVKSAASKVTHLFTQPSKHSGTEPLPATVPAMNGLGYGNPGASVAALDPVPHSDQAVQTKPAYSGDGSSGAAVISLAALSTGHPQRSHQPCSMKRQTEVPVGSQLEQSNGATTHALFLEGGFQFDAQSAPSAEVGEPSVPTNGANADR